VLELLRVPATLEQAVTSLELSGLAKQAHELAQRFNSFYHRFAVVQEERETIRTTRLAIVRLYHDRMLELLDLMGIDVPDRM
jgi:arginyl-tRNA synthetase